MGLNLTGIGSVAEKDYPVNPIVEEIDYKYVRFAAWFRIYSKLLGGWILFPIYFVCDRESVPALKGTSIRGGYAHDLLCRIDAYLYILMDDGMPVPEITKALAAKVYFEIMETRYELVNDAEKNKTVWNKITLGFKKTSRWGRRWIKYGVVRIAPGYFHKHKVLDPLEKIKG